MEKGKYLLENKKDIVKELYLNSNLSLTKIAEQLGVSRQTVTNFVKKEGWYHILCMMIVRFTQKENS